MTVWGGITRLQKLLFLLEREQQLRPQGDSFEFAPYKAGPYSSRLYDDLELLENLGLLETEATAVATDIEAADIDAVTFEELMSDPEEDDISPDKYEERRFRLSPTGRERVEKLLADDRLRPVVEKIDHVTLRYGQKTLDDLLYYVYTKYPEMTVASEIKDQVLGRARRY